VHNNGTTPQIIRPDRRLLPNLQPETGFDIQVTPQGIVFSPHIGHERLSILLDGQKATELGVALISVAALFAHAQQAVKPDPNARPNGSVSTAPPIVIPDNLRD
jgi:hypothetical protein